MHWKQCENISEIIYIHSNNDNNNSYDDDVRWLLVIKKKKKRKKKKMKNTLLSVNCNHKMNCTLILLLTFYFRSRVVYDKVSLKVAAWTTSTSRESGDPLPYLEIALWRPHPSSHAGLRSLCLASCHSYLGKYEIVRNIKDRLRLKRKKDDLYSFYYLSLLFTFS